MQSPAPGVLGGTAPGGAGAGGAGGELLGTEAGRRAPVPRAQDVTPVGRLHLPECSRTDGSRTDSKLKERPSELSRADAPSSAAGRMGRQKHTPASEEDEMPDATPSAAVFAAWRAEGGSQGGTEPPGAEEGGTERLPPLTAARATTVAIATCTEGGAMGSGAMGADGADMAATQLPAPMGAMVGVGVTSSRTLEVLRELDEAPMPSSAGADAERLLSRWRELEALSHSPIAAATAIAYPYTQRILSRPLRQLLSTQEGAPGTEGAGAARVWAIDEHSGVLLAACTALRTTGALLRQGDSEQEAGAEVGLRGGDGAGGRRGAEPWRDVWMSRQCSEQPRLLTALLRLALTRGPAEDASAHVVSSYVSRPSSSSASRPSSARPSASSPPALAAWQSMLLQSALPLLTAPLEAPPKSDAPQPSGSASLPPYVPSMSNAAPQSQQAGGAMDPWWGALIHEVEARGSNEGPSGLELT